VNAQQLGLSTSKKDSRVDRYFTTTVHNIIGPSCLAYCGNGSECESTQAATRTTGANPDVEIEPVSQKKYT